MSKENRTKNATPIIMSYDELLKLYAFWPDTDIIESYIQQAWHQLRLQYVWMYFIFFILGYDIETYNRRLKKYKKKSWKSQ